MMTTVDYTIEIDLHPRTRVGMNEQMTMSGYNDVHGEGHLVPGTSVLAVDRVTGLAAPAIVVGTNRAATLVYFVVAWREMKDRAEYGPPICDCSH